MTIQLANLYTNFYTQMQFNQLLVLSQSNSSEPLLIQVFKHADFEFGN